jgi:nitronate monooxygenase
MQTVSDPVAAEVAVAAGADVLIAQGGEAGGNGGSVATLVLVPAVLDAVGAVPVVAAGGIADGRGIAAAFMLGASGVQIGTAFLLCPEAEVSALHAAALRSPAARTALTNVFTGRPARSVVTRLMRDVGPLSPDAPAFPHAAGAVLPLRAAAEQSGDTSFTSLWSGQAAALARELPAGELTRTLAAAALQRLR